MDTQKKFKKYRLFVIPALVFILLIAGVNWVMAQTEGVINACMIPTDGTIRIVSDPAECKKNEELLSWNIMGPKGDKGDAGEPGPAGEPGLAGPAGSAGENGLACWDLNGDHIQDTAEDINQDGVWNAADCQGAQGETGATGAQGPQGIQGLQGEVGAQGPIGLTGPQGLQGEQGPAGPQGERGPAGTGIASVDALDGLPCQVGQPGEGVIALSYDPITGNVTITCNPAILYTLTIEKTGGSTRTVFSNPAGIDCGSTCSFTFPAGRLIELSNDGGESFVGWGGACSGSGACQVVMNSDITVTATYVTDHHIFLNLLFQEFAMPPYYFIASGRVLVDGWQTCTDPYCTYTYADGQTITFEAIADSGSIFGFWDGICAGEPSTICTVTIDEADPIDLDVEAVFQLNP